MGTERVELYYREAILKKEKDYDFEAENFDRG